jgi:hypothetical protein
MRLAGIRVTLNHFRLKAVWGLLNVGAREQLINSVQNIVAEVSFLALLNLRAHRKRLLYQVISV